jgi:hypothetical protein
MVYVTADLRKKVQKKLYEYQRKDVRIKKQFPIQNINCETITLLNALEIIEHLETDKCTVCNCSILFDYIPYCMHQFSFDRIVGTKIHSKDNLRIICLHCNVSLGIPVFVNRTRQNDTAEFIENIIGCKPNCKNGCHKFH